MFLAQPSLYLTELDLVSNLVVVNQFNSVHLYSIIPNRSYLRTLYRDKKQVISYVGVGMEISTTWLQLRNAC